MVGPHAVGLLDFDLAELRGASLAGGSLASLRGIHLLPVVAGDEGSYIKGYGKISGNVVAGTNMPDPTPDLRARIWAFGGKIEVTGILSGAWTPIGNVDVTGLARPGFSAILGLAGAPAPMRQLEFEIYGDVGQQDKLPSGIVNNLNLPMADPAHGYDQYLVYADLPVEMGGSGDMVIPVLGPFSVKFPMGYVPTAGDDFKLIFSHQFDPFDGELGPDGVLQGARLAYEPTFVSALPGLLNTLPPLGAGLSYVPYLGQDAFGIKVVPEPGTLALLLSGGLGLLLLIWRRKRS